MDTSAETVNETLDEGLLDEALSDKDIPDAAASADSEGGSSGFAPVVKRFESEGHKEFDNPAYYKTALAGGGNLVQRLHGLFQKLTQAKDPKDRTLFRQQIIPAYWEFAGHIAQQAASALPPAKRFLLRYGMLHPGLLTPDTRKLFSTIIVGKTSPEPVFYIDEWLAGIGRTEINPSGTDEAPVRRGNQDARLKELLEKAQGKLEGARNMLSDKDRERLQTEKELQARVSAFTSHVPSQSLPEVNDRYSDNQRKMAGEIQDLAKLLIRADRELEILLRDYESARADIATISAKMQAGGGAAAVADTAAISGEFQTVRQMVKMTIGRQGNAFPILSNEYFRCIPNGIGTRENVISALSWIENIDSEAFFRVYKNKPVRIVPYVLLLPTYGDLGVCWEPFERANKATSRGRIAIPMYPKNLTIAVLSAVADLRWQVAKEKASYYWMEEGLTGNYYQWFAKQKLKGDIKWYFIQDYLLWMTKESEGTQKLDKEVRGVFWRYMPFTRPIKEKLKGRNLVYQELYQRDLNRAMSDI